MMKLMFIGGLMADEKPLERENQLRIDDLVRRINKLENDCGALREDLSTFQRFNRELVIDQDRIHNDVIDIKEKVGMLNAKKT